jgi:hypothetical protein
MVGRKEEASTRLRLCQTGLQATRNKSNTPYSVKHAPDVIHLQIGPVKGTAIDGDGRRVEIIFALTDILELCLLLEEDVRLTYLATTTLMRS